MNRTIKFRRAHYWKEAFLKYTYWGFIDDSFISPSHISCSDSHTDEQFTGLHDKNGKEIYEGDIITDNIGTDGIVFWDQNDCSFAIIWGHDEQLEPLYSEHQNSLEITGNIHDND